MWNTVLLATTEEELSSVKKRFLSRTARYSGLLNILEFAGIDFTNNTSLSTVLQSASAWLAFNVTEDDIPSYAQSAVQAGVKRAVFTVQLPPSRINDTVIPQFNDAIRLFEENEGSFTGIRHGTIIPGNEDNSYEIANSTSPCAQDTVERGVLSRVVAELLRAEASSNTVCGLSSGNAFAAAYLNILRSSGLTRKQEVEKIFKGGIQRVAQLTVASYEAQRKQREEREAAREKEKVGDGDDDGDDDDDDGGDDDDDDVVDDGDDNDDDYNGDDDNDDDDGGDDKDYNGDDDGGDDDDVDDDGDDNDDNGDDDNDDDGNGDDNGGDNDGGDDGDDDGNGDDNDGGDDDDDDDFSDDDDDDDDDDDGQVLGCEVCYSDTHV